MSEQPYHRSSMPLMWNSTTLVDRNDPRSVDGWCRVLRVLAVSGHGHRNGGKTTARVRVQVEPALDMAQLLATTAELAHQGKVLRSGLPKPLHLALFVQRFRREVRAPFPPPWIVRPTLAPLGALARRRGYALA